MVVVRANEASSSTCYDAFSSYRGEDTHKTFTDQLYTTSVQQEYLKLELEKAIPQSKSSKIVISENYASSRWCIDELVMILEGRRNSGNVASPVFYDVDPSHVRKQIGRTAEAFARYEDQFEAKQILKVKENGYMEHIQGWRSTLTEVDDLIGLDLKDQVDV